METIKLDSRTRYIIFGTLGAFFLSVLVGLFSKNPFGIIFIRAVVSSFIFGSILFGAWQLIKRFIPELLTRKNGEDTLAEAHEHTEVSADYSVPGVNRFEESGVTSPVEKLSEAPGITGEKLKFPESGLDEEPHDADELPSFDNLLDEDEMLPDERIEEETEKNGVLKSDYIDVGNMKFPNEPEILAKMVKRVMSQDEYE